MAFFPTYFEDIYAATKNIDEDILKTCAEAVRTTSKQGGKVIIVGNGGSAAIASHISVDFTKAAGIRAINFNEADLLTCFSNDFGFEKWVEKAFVYYADPKDLIFIISSSGSSPNMIRGAEKAKNMGIYVITLSGFEEANTLRTLGDVNLWVDSKKYNTVEMAHHIWLLAIVDYLIEEGI